MSTSPRRDESRDPAEPTSNPIDPAISDLPKQVKTDEADKVRGGINPQPLPPRHGD